jgi:hypothetical protein
MEVSFPQNFFSLFIVKGQTIGDYIENTITDRLYIVKDDLRTHFKKGSPRLKKYFFFGCLYFMKFFFRWLYLGYELLGNAFKTVFITVYT